MYDLVNWGRAAGRGEQRLDINEGGEGAENRIEKSMRGETQVEHKRKTGETWRQRVHEQEEAEAERRYRKSRIHRQTERKGNIMIRENKEGWRQTEKVTNGTSRVKERGKKNSTGAHET